MARSTSWMYSIIPISAVSGGLGIILPLYILELGGTVFNVGVAVALFELVSIPASIFWGDLTDRLTRTKVFIIFSILGTIPILLIFYLVAFVPVVESVYGLYAFIATASSPAINILIMSGRVGRALPKHFSRYSVFSIMGSFAGMLPGLFLNQDLIGVYLLIIMSFNIIALIVAIFLIKTTHREQVRRKNITAVGESFAVLNQLSHTPFILTSTRLLERIRRRLSDERVRNIYALLATIALFNLGMYLFNSSYIPYLRGQSLSYSDIFLINIINSAAQLLVYGVFIALVRKINLGRYYKAATVFRTIGYAMTFVPFLLIDGGFLYLNIAGYAITGLAYAMWNVTSSVLLYTQIRKLGKGHYIGVWVALLGFSAVIGSLFSGIMSSYVGYNATFSLSILAIIGSLIVFARYEGAIVSKKPI